MCLWFGVLLLVSILPCSLSAMQDLPLLDPDSILFGNDVVQYSETTEGGLPQPLPVLRLNNESKEDDQDWSWYDTTKAMAFIGGVEFEYIKGRSAKPLLSLELPLLDVSLKGRGACVRVKQEEEPLVFPLQGPWLSQERRHDFSEQTSDGHLQLTRVGEEVTKNIVDACYKINFQRLWRLWEQVPDEHCEEVRKVLWGPYSHLQLQGSRIVEDQRPVLLNWAAITKLIYQDYPSCHMWVQKVDEWAGDYDVLTDAWNKLQEDRIIDCLPCIGSAQQEVVQQ